ncbi:unnamed protein product [Ceratitis capitata]|uniref:(Mediterranean fruit fly) hypothetical protein n=1 Tax=Ceratitis capitata TaxID=7213 RepID=A0A811UX61_CERCA|nr:unnamed protein product [Ceratitis capitata]
MEYFFDIILTNNLQYDNTDELGAAIIIGGFNWIVGSVGALLVASSIVPVSAVVTSTMISLRLC